MEETQKEEEGYLKADVLNRFLAKFVDSLIIAVLFMLLKPVGPLVGLSYLLLSDGLKGGKSLGKRLIGLKVINTKTGKDSSYKDSMLRNLTLGAIVFFAMIPFLGWVLLFTIGVVILAFESYMIYMDEHGIRIGDILANTQVVDD